METPDARTDRSRIEEEIVAALSAGDREGAVSGVLREYGPEVLRFLAALHRDRVDAEEVFSMFAEAVWKAMPSFEHRASVRTWAYAIARRSSLRFRRDRRRREARQRPFPNGSELSLVEAKIRSETLSFMRTERRSALRALREALPKDDQMLLMLRVDRGLSWDELARVLREDESTPLSADALKREAARLRKRFQMVKDKLRASAKRARLLREPDES